MDNRRRDIAAASIGRLSSSVMYPGRNQHFLYRCIEQYGDPSQHLRDDGARTIDVHWRTSDGYTRSARAASSLLA
ncbi:hypothetical protein XU06_30115 (plasmid) [Rhodococcus erythropolis]|nr:hypothetical protein XU06_30115 [Rhodococcus erythropolis]